MFDKQELTLLFERGGDDIIKKLLFMLSEKYQTIAAIYRHKEDGVQEMSNQEILAVVRGNRQRLETLKDIEKFLTQERNNYFRIKKEASHE